MKFSDSISARTTSWPITRLIPASLCYRLMALLTALAFAGSVHSQVFINEIHYDNASSDAGEAIFGGISQCNP